MCVFDTEINDEPTLKLVNARETISVMSTKHAPSIKHTIRDDWKAPSHKNQFHLMRNTQKMFGFGSKTNDKPTPKFIHVREKLSIMGAKKIRCFIS